MLISAKQTFLTPNIEGGVYNKKIYKIDAVMDDGVWMVFKIQYNNLDIDLYSNKDLLASVYVDFGDGNIVTMEKHIDEDTNPYLFPSYGVSTIEFNQIYRPVGEYTVTIFSIDPSIKCTLGIGSGGVLLDEI